MTFIAYFAEAVAVHLIDWFVGGLAGWLIGRGGKGRGIGIVLAILYAMAVAGMFMGSGRPDYFGPIAATVAFGVLLWFGARRSRSRSLPDAL